MPPKDSIRCTYVSNKGRRCRNRASTARHLCDYHMEWPSEPEQSVSPVASISGRTKIRAAVVLSSAILAIALLAILREAPPPKPPPRLAPIEPSTPDRSTATKPEKTNDSNTSSSTPIPKSVVKPEDWARIHQASKRTADSAQTPGEDDLVEIIDIRRNMRLYEKGTFKIAGLVTEVRGTTAYVMFMGAWEIRGETTRVTTVAVSTTQIRAAYLTPK